MRQERETAPAGYLTLWKIIRPVLVGIAAVLIVIGLVLFAYDKVNEHFLSPVEEGSAEPVPFSVASGSSLSKVSQNLEDAGLIRSHTFFKYYCDFAGLGQKIQAGDYTLSRDMDVFAIADRLTAGDGQSMTAEITIIPGNTVDSVAAMLMEKGILNAGGVEEFRRICRTGEGVEDYYFIDDEKKLAYAKYRPYLLEGYLAPNTYEIYTTATPLEIIRKLLSQTDKVFTPEWQAAMEEQGKTMDDILILASMIEKEGKKADFTRVSAVFRNRLKQKMKLQSDPTIHYVTGVRRMSLTKEDLATNSPYNTYLVAGLPAGPICNPSPEAIEAALYPDESFTAEKYLYFCSKDPETGELYFSRTLEEHERAVSIYQPLWQAYDQKRGL